MMPGHIVPLGVDNTAPQSLTTKPSKPFFRRMSVSRSRMYVAAFPGKIWTLAEILEIETAQRAAFDVEALSQQHGATFHPAFLPEGRAQPFHCFGMTEIMAGTGWAVPPGVVERSGTLYSFGGRCVPPGDDAVLPMNQISPCAVPRTCRGHDTEGYRHRRPSGREWHGSGLLGLL